MDEEPPHKMLMPISGYEYMPPVSLAKAVEWIAFLLAAIPSYAYTGKQRCEEPIPRFRNLCKSGCLYWRVG
jgi:hypothetical protein